jgi:hypothetical protein
MEKFDTFVKNKTGFLNNPYVSGALSAFLIIYAGAAAPKLPASVMKMFDYTLVKLVMFFMIVYMSKQNATVALLSAIALMVSIMAVNNIKISKEMMTVVKNDSKKLSTRNLNCKCTEISSDNLQIATSAMEDDDEENVEQEMDVDTDEELVVENVTEEPLTADGKMVKKAVKMGVLTEKGGKKLLKKVVESEILGEPVLNVKTEEGNNRLGEINNLVNSGAVDGKEARKMVATVVVSEEVAEENMNNEEDIENMADEVVKIKENETAMRGGVPPSDDELQNICASVIHNRRMVASNDEVVGATEELPGIDSYETSYESVE